MTQSTFTDDERAAYTPGALVQYKTPFGRWFNATVVSGPHQAHGDSREYMLVRNAVPGPWPPYRRGDQLYVPPSRIRRHPS